MVKTYLMYAIVFLITILFAGLYQNSKVTDKNVLTSNRVRLYNFPRLYFYILILATPVFLGAVRWGVGVDFWNYLEKYHNYQSINMIEALKESREPLYNLLNYTADFLFYGKDWGVFFLSSFIIMLFILLTLDYYKKKVSLPMGLFIYFMIYYIESFNLVRQSIALSIVLYAYCYVLERRPFKYLFIILIAYLFHNSAIICIFFYLLSYKKSNFSSFKNMVYYILIIVSPFLIGQLLLLLNYIPFLNFYTERYNFTSSTIGYGYGFLIETIPVVVPALIFKRKLIKENPNYEFFVNLALLSVPLRLAGYYLYWISRMVYYASMIQIILIPIILCLIRNKLKRRVAYLIFILFYIGYFFYVFVINNRGPAYPYQNIFTFTDSWW